MRLRPSLRILLPSLAATAMVVALLGPAGEAASVARLAAVAPVSVGHSDWTWGSPTPQGENLAAVSFQGADGYAVGVFGTVLRSDDSGATWAGLSSGVTADLDLVQALDPSTVLVAGRCTVLESTDAGQRFTTLSLPEADPCHDPVAGIAFSDADHGVVLLTDGTLLRTDDAGRTFTALPSPPLGAGHATGMAFSSATTGLVVSSAGTIARTTDGGRTWARADQASTGLSGVTVVGAEVAYAVGTGPGLLGSTDGGASWTPLPLAIASAGPQALRSISCADADHCLITTSDAGTLVSTADGGLTGALTSVAAGSVRAVAYATDAIVGVGDVGATALSADGGRTFNAIDPDSLTKLLASPGALGNLRPGLAPGTLYLPGVRGKIAATVDGGQTWSLLQVPTHGRIRDVAFTSRRDGYALDGDGVLWATVDGGVDWRAVSTGHRVRPALLAPRRGTLLMITGGRGHAVYRSTDGGVHFTPLPERVSGVHLKAQDTSFGPLFGLEDAVVEHGDILGIGGFGIFVSADAARSWRRIPAPPGGDVGLNLSVLSPTRLWAIGDGGLWSTTDGGHHWTSHPSLGGLSPDLVSFSSPQDGLMVVASPELPSLGGPSFDDNPLNNISILATRDGGRTWAPEVVGGLANSSWGLFATPSADYLVTNTASVSGRGGNGLGLFASSDGGLAARPTTLTVGFRHPSLSSRALAEAGHRVLIRGHVAPAPTGGSILLSTRIGSASWKLTGVPVKPDGSFQLDLRMVDANVQVVAQVLGDETTAGAGSPAELLTIDRTPAGVGPARPKEGR